MGAPISTDNVFWVTALTALFLAIYVLFKANESEDSAAKDRWPSELLSVLTFGVVTFGLHVAHQGIGTGFATDTGLATGNGLRITLWVGGGAVALAASLMLFQVESVPFYKNVVVRLILLLLLASPVFLQLATDDQLSGTIQNIQEIPLLQPEPSDAEVERIKEAGGSVSDAVGDSMIAALLLFSYHLTLWSIILIYLGELWSSGQKNRPVGFDQTSVDRTVAVFALGVAAIVALLLSGANFISIGIFSGLLAAGLSLSMRELLNNIAAGLMLLWDESIAVKHVIETEDGTTGEIKRMTMRYTLVQDREHRETLIPNAVLVTGEIRNYSRSKEVRLGVDYPVELGSDIDDAIATAEKACLSVRRVLKYGDPPRTFLREYTQWAAILDVRFWIADPEQGIRNVKSQVLRAVTTAFQRKGIKTPHPIYTVGLRPTGADASDENEPLVISRG